MDSSNVEILFRIAILNTAIGSASIVYFFLLARSIKSCQRTIEVLRDQINLRYLHSFTKKDQLDHPHPLEKRLHELQNATFSKMSHRKIEK